MTLTVTLTHKPRRLGFTMAEALIANLLLSVLFIGALTVFVAGVQQAVKTGAAGSAVTDAGGALQRVTQDAREALWCALPDDAGGYFTPAPGFGDADFEAGAAHDTGLELVFPAAAAAAVVDGAGVTRSLPACDRGGPAPAGSSLWFYRADRDGTPDAQAGTCLWMQGTERGQSVNQAILTSVAASPDAVQFRRPADGAATPASLPYQVQVKIVSAYYSPVRGPQSNEATDGSLVTLTVGKCVLLRDHELNLDHEPAPAASGGAYSATSTN